jgi:light-regulated signal transduction histidine kinase (bacteriophytochrome)
VVRLQSARDAASLAQIAAEQVRALTGFDRVMVYRFDAEWNGEVVAESKREDLEPFLGLHYPASDIPAQARRLYTINWLRFIADVGYRPSPLVPRADPETGAPLDLGHAALRSVSPIHIEYLKNMGVAASMSVSLVIDGALAGLIACHHYSGPWLVPYRVRDTVEFLGQALSWQLRVLEAAAADQRERVTQVHESEIVRAIATSTDLREGLATPALLALVDAAGAAIVLDEGMRTVGEVPPEAAVRALVAELRWSDRDVITVDRLTEELPSLTPELPGLLAVAISRGLGEYILWFRRPTEQTVDWAGDPRKALVAAAGVPPRLSPRGSFALWRETVRGRALPWDAWHVRAASNLRQALLGVVRMRTAELRALNERLLEADRAKDDFIAIVSHELRTPLNAISGYRQLMGTGEGPRETIRKGLEVIERNTRALTELVDDLLDVSRMVSGKLALELDPVDLVALVESVIESFAVAAQAKQLRIKRVLDSSATPVLGDDTRLRQVVANLLSNAVKFTPKGGSVTVTLTRADSDAELTVADSGQGIAPELLPLVFDLFRQGDSGLNRRSRGLGIGLALARRITELHGGRITAESAGTGQGAVFRVRIPMAPVRRQQAGSAVPELAGALVGLRCLVVDDDRDASDLVAALLAKDGAEVTIAPDAAAALAMIGVRELDVLISDVGMPDIDGIQLMRELRQRPAERGGRLPAVALTAYGRAHDRTAVLTAGFSAHVRKPVDAEELVAVVASVCGRTGRTRD